MIDIQFMIPLGIQEAICGIVGNCIGANNVPLAKRFFSLTFWATLVIVLLISMATILARHKILELYTNDEALIEMATPLMIMTGCNFLGDGM